jgi:hypothetical protein
VASSPGKAGGIKGEPLKADKTGRLRPLAPLTSSCCDTEFGSEIDREPGDLVANSMKFA